MAKFDLVGYVRKSQSGNSLKISLEKDALEKAQTYTSRDGKEYVSLISNISTVKDLIDGGREFTTVSRVED